jgi:hypothetical protein
MRLKVTPRRRGRQDDGHTKKAGTRRYGVPEVLGSLLLWRLRRLGVSAVFAVAAALLAPLCSHAAICDLPNYPTTACTGIPAGTTLTTISGNYAATTNGQVIDSKLITGGLDINADNVVIKNSRIYGTVTSRDGHPFTIQDSEIGPTSGCDGNFAIGFENYTATRLYIHNFSDGPRVSGDNVTVQDSYLNICSSPGDHSDGVQGYGGGSNVTLRHNTIDQRGAQDVTAPVFFADNSKSCNCVNNLLLANSASGLALRIHDDHTPDIGPWIITGNRLIGGASTTNTECAAASTSWSDNRQVTIDANYNLLTTGALVNCDGSLTDPPPAIYIGQSAAGSGDGSSCASAKAISFFNTAGNWGTGSSQIGPGKTVKLCGTITSALTLLGSGTSGNPITVDGTAATLGTGVSVNTNNKSWWKLVNLTWADGANSTLIQITGGSNGVVENVHGDAINDGAVFLAQGTTGRPDTITVRNSFFRTGAQDYGNTQHDIIATEGSLNVLIEGNYLEMRAGGAGGQAHDDVLQTWESGSTASAGPPGNWTIRYNRIVMNSNATNDRSWTMFENLTGTNYIYGNVFLGLQGADQANGLSAGGSGAIFYIENNTFIAKGSASNNVLNLGAPGTAFVQNNIFHLQGQTGLTGTMTVIRANNHWFGSSIPSCAGASGDVCGTNPNFVDYANNNFALQSGSIDRAAGTNLGAGPAGQTLGIGIAPSATWPNPATLPRSAWDRGAYQFNGGAAPPSACDINADSATNVSDVQICANQAIGVVACSSGDVNKDGVCNVVDVQRDVNAALGGICVSQ